MGAAKKHGPAAYPGIDVGKSGHSARALDAGGGVVFRADPDNGPDAIDRLPERAGVIPSMYFSPIAQTDRPRVRKRTFTNRANGPSPLPASRRPSSPAAGPSACTTCP